MSMSTEARFRLLTKSEKECSDHDVSGLWWEKKSSMDAMMKRGCVVVVFRL